MRPLRCDFDFGIAPLIFTDPFFVSSSFDSTVIQPCSRDVHSQQSQEMNHSVCTQRLGANVGWTVFHCPPSSIGSAPFRLLPDTHQSALISRCFTRPDGRLVITPRGAAESPCTRQTSGQPNHVRNCCSWIPHAAARVAAYNYDSPLESEMTPCVPSPSPPNRNPGAHAKVLQLGSGWR